MPPGIAKRATAGARKRCAAIVLGCGLACRAAIAQDTAPADWLTLPHTITQTPVTEVISSQATLTFTPEEGRDYEVQATEDIGSLQWHPLPGGPHNFGSITYFSAEAKQFFRVIDLETRAMVPSVLDLQLRRREVGKNMLLTYYGYPGWPVEVQQFDIAQESWQPWTNGRQFLATGAVPELRVVTKPPVDVRNFEAILVGGQSNALLYNDADYPEKIDSTLYLDAGFQFRAPSRRNPEASPLYTYSFAREAAIALGETAPRKRLLLPVAKGSTWISDWLPGTNRFDPQTLFGQANYRRMAAAPQGLTAVWYFGHESSMDFFSLPAYAENWQKLIEAFREEMGPVPFIYAQVAKHTVAPVHALMHAGAEIQRQCETNIPNHHMVVTFDLPLADHIHISAEGHEMLGRRFALAMREHVYGEDVNGTGPRLEAVEFTSPARDEIAVRFNRPINECTNVYDGQFQVLDESEPVPIAEMRRGDDERSVVIRLASPIQGLGAVDYGTPFAEGEGRFLANVVRDADGLPAPQFGPLPIAEFGATAGGD